MLSGLLLELAVAMQAVLLQSSSSLWNSYCNQLRRRPLLTKAATGVVGTIIGDGVAQFTSRNSRSPDVPVYDVARATRLCTYAAVIGSPIGHYWFNFLDKVRLCADLLSPSPAQHNSGMHCQRTRAPSIRVEPILQVSALPCGCGSSA